LIPARELLQDVSEFQNASERFRKGMITLGVPYHEPPPGFATDFAKLDEKSRSRAIEGLKFYLHLCEVATERSWAPLNDHRLTWYALKRIGLKPPSSLFTHLQPESCIEIYDSAGVQIYRNFNFCKYVTYSLEELLIYPWTDLYGRNDEIFKHMGVVAGQAFTSKDPFDPAIPVHPVRELRSMGHREMNIHFEWVSPLFNETTGRTEAFLSISNLTPVARASTGVPKNVIESNSLDA
jgi:hypothetical protein